MRIILSGGGTLGSVTPLIAVWQRLKKYGDGREIQTLWVGTRRGPEKELVSSYGLEFTGIISAKLRRAFDLRNIFIPFLLFAGYLQSFLVLSRFKPEAVATSGGFVSVPLVWAAWILGIPIYLHQEDAKIGLANLLMTPFARAVTTAFPETAKRFPHPRVRCIGNPVREEIIAGASTPKEDARQRFGFDSAKPVLLVLGGGTGALGLNRAIAAHKDELTKSFNLIHVVGRGKGEERSEKEYFSREFLDKEEMPLAIRAADFALSRAGMGTIAELAAAGLPVILTPISGSHQEENASYLGKKAAVFVLTEKDINSGRAVSLLRGLAGDAAMVAELKMNLKKIFSPDAAEEAAQIWLKGISKD